MKNDVENYIERRKRTDKVFAKDFDAGYEEFKIGVMLREAREQAGGFFDQPHAAAGEVDRSVVYASKLQPMAVVNTVIAGK